MVCGFEYFVRELLLAEICIDDTSRSNESTCQATLARIREQVCIVSNLNTIKTISLIMSNISRIGITLRHQRWISHQPIASLSSDCVWLREPTSWNFISKVHTFHTFFVPIQATPKHITLEVISIKKQVPCQNERKPVRQAQENACENRVIIIESIKKWFHPHESKPNANLSWETRIQFLRANWSNTLANQSGSNLCPWRINVSQNKSLTEQPVSVDPVEMKLSIFRHVGCE